MLGKYVCVCACLLFLGCALSIAAFAQQEISAAAGQQTLAAQHRTIAALAFNYIAGTPSYLDQFGLVEGASVTPPATGVANVAISDGSVVTAFTVCGRDFASDQEFAGDLKRKTIDPSKSAFSPPEVMAHVHSGISFFKDAMVCLKSSIATGKGKIDNAKWTYFAEITIGDTTEVIAVKIDY